MTETILINKADYLLTTADIQNAIDTYCDELNIKSPADLTAQQFSGLCHVIGNRFFDNRVLRNTTPIYSAPHGGTSTCNSYDADTMLTLAEYYILLCQTANKIPSFTDFAYLCHVPRDSIYAWYDNSERYSNPTNIRIAKMIHDASEQAYFNRLSDNKNAIAQIQYGRSKGFLNDLDTTRPGTTTIVLSADDLPKLKRKEQHNV